MNYGFNPTKFDDKLADRLRTYLTTLPPDKYNMMPYIEVDGLYPGVRIHRITHYSLEIRRQIVENAERIFKECEKEEV